jgi:hypothetical protein
MRFIWKKLKVKWNVETDIRMIRIFIIFAITGSSITLVRRPFTEIFFDKSTYGGLHWYELIITLIAVYFMYQVLLFIIGSLLGEYKFIRWFLLKMNKRFFPFLKNLE